jgi:hypothetical protein
LSNGTSILSMARTVKPASRKYLANMALSLWKVGRAHDGFCLQRAQRVDVILRHGHDWRAIFLFPPLYDLGFALSPLDHEWRRSVGMNEIAAALGQHGDQLLVGRHHGLELVLRAAAREKSGIGVPRSRMTSSVTPGRGRVIMPTTPASCKLMV